jgi:hypothetical protein
MSGRYSRVLAVPEGLGLRPTLLSTILIDQLFAVVESYKHRLDEAAITPTVRWDATASELPKPTGGLVRT